MRKCPGNAYASCLSRLSETYRHPLCYGPASQKNYMSI